MYDAAWLVPSWKNLVQMKCFRAFLQADRRLLSNVEESLVVPTHGILFADSRFWVIHRAREFGPFDYQFSSDLHGIELTYQGEKFGEYISDAEIYADLKPFQLPMTVVRVASIVSGSILFGILNSLDTSARIADAAKRLRSHGYDRFADDIRNRDDAA